MTKFIDKANDEKKTVKIMIKLYCNKKHYTNDDLCEGCEELLKYAYERLDSCRYGINKSTCGKCKIHCYKADMRKKIIEVMRFSGPRMTYVHPVLAFKHLVKRYK